MPVYEYYCQACEHEWEREQRISDDPLKTCPKCKARKAKRMISRTSFVLKGSGWYSDLYSSSKKDTAEKGAQEGEKGAQEGEKSAKGSGKDKPEKKKKDSGGGKSGSGGDGKSKSSSGNQAAA